MWSVSPVRKRLLWPRVRPDAAVLGGDTVVALDGEILGKPRDPRHAEEMLLRLAARDHVVCSGLAIALPFGRRAEWRGRHSRAVAVR